MTVAPASRPQVQSLYVIYDADGTRTGELIYIAKKLIGLAHCAACDITHGPRREKPEFTQLKETWPVPVYNIHRDEMDPLMNQAVASVLPCVVARTGENDVRVMDPDHLQSCAGDVLLFAKRVRERVGEEGLSMPEKRNDVCERRIRGGDDGVRDVPDKVGFGVEDDDEDVRSVSTNGDAVVPSPVF